MDVIIRWDYRDVVCIAFITGLHYNEHVQFNAEKGNLYRLLNTFYIFGAQGKCLKFWLKHHMSKMF